MAAIANSPSFAKKAGVPRSVGKDFTAADKALKLPARAGSRPDLQKVNNPKTNQGRNELFKEGGDTMATKMNPGMMAMMAKKKAGAKPEMPTKKMASGGMTSALEKHAGKPASKAHAGLKGGGYVRAADGIASKGMTKAARPTMAGSTTGMKKGGKC
jgi:hypothetical protein